MKDSNGKIKFTKNEVKYIKKKMKNWKPTKNEILEFVEKQKSNKFWERVVIWVKTGMYEREKENDCFGRATPDETCGECKNSPVCEDAKKVLNQNTEELESVDGVDRIKKQFSRSVKSALQGKDSYNVVDEATMKLIAKDILKPLVGVKLKNSSNDGKGIIKFAKFSNRFPELNLEDKVRNWCEINNERFDDVWNTQSLKVYYYARKIMELGK